MTSKRWIVPGIIWVVLVALIVVVVSAAPPPHEPQRQESIDEQATTGTAFTYQGRIQRGGQAVSGVCNFQFSLYAGVSGGSPVESPLALSGVTVTDGLFTVQLDFGAGAFVGDARWLGIQVQCPGDDAYADLGRQALTAAPYALYALGAPWGGLSGVPAGLADGIDDDTTYTVTAGLVLSGTTLAADTGYLQRRVSGACPAGTSLRAIHPDGTVDCESGDPMPYRARAPEDNAIVTLDSQGDVGEYNSVTIGSDGLPLISYFDRTNGDLKVAHCGDVRCSTAITATVDGVGNVGYWPSTAIGADGLPVIGYSGGGLKVAHCSDVQCTSAVTSTVDSDPDAGAYASIAIGADGLPLIAYYRSAGATDGDLKVAHCGDVLCSSADTITTLDVDRNVGYWTSVRGG